MVLVIVFKFSFVSSKKCLEARSCQPAPAVPATTSARGTVTESGGGGERKEGGRGEGEEISLVARVPNIAKVSSDEKNGEDNKKCDVKNLFMSKVKTIMS